MTDDASQPCPRNEQAVAWALHSLEPDEEMEVLLHLPECSSCRQVVDEAGEVLSYLGAAVQQIDPPAGLRDRLLAQVAQTPQQSSESPQPMPAPAPPRSAEPAAGRGPTDNRPGRRSRWTRGRRRLLAGALALVAVLAIGGLAARNAQLAAERDAQIAQSHNLTNLIDQLGRPGVRHALLAAVDGSTVAAVVVQDGREQVFPMAMSPNAADRNTYVLWGIAAGADPRPLGTFDVSGSDQGLVSVGDGAGSDSFVAYAVSLEPGRAAPAVPTEVVAKGAVAA